MTRSDQPHNPIVIFATRENALFLKGKVNTRVAQKLEEFRQAGDKIYLVTDGLDLSARHAEQDIQNAGFPDLIARSITSSMLGMHSIEPNYYLRLTNSVGVKPTDTIYIDHTAQALNFAKRDGAHIVSSDLQQGLIERLTATYEKMKHRPT